MQKLLIITVIVAFMLTSCAAIQKRPTETAKAKDVNVGAKTGANFATINSDNFDSFDNRTAFHVGLVAEFGISETFSFQPELLYSSQGSDYSDPGFDGTIKLDYLNVPLMAKFYVGEGFSLEVGPQVGFLLSATDEGDGYDIDMKDYVKGIDFGVNVGVGYKLDGGLNFGARYNLGLTDVNDGYEEGGTYKNGVIQAYVGYFF